MTLRRNSRRSSRAAVSGAAVATRPGRCRTGASVATVMTVPP